MSSRRCSGLVAVAALAIACHNPESGLDPTPPNAPAAAPPAAAPDQERGPHERLAARIARAMQDPGFRLRVFRAIEASPFPEHKIHLQGFLMAGGFRERRSLAALSGEDERAVQADLDQTRPIEVYLPVSEHRRSWQGSTNLIVATAELDGEAPVGFDLMGRRITLDATRPPSTPVLMVARAEQTFDGAAAAPCVGTCPGGGGGTTPPSGPGLYLTQAQYTETFESWFKGNPEFEVHVLGQDGATNKLMSYQCAGEYAGGAYAFDQNSTSWSGNVLLFSQSQFAQYNQAHPGQNVRVFVLEDDDTACQIKVDSTRASNLFKQLKLTYGSLTGGKDSTATGGILRFFKKAASLFDLFKAASNLIKTNDDIVGNAVEDAAAAQSFFPGANWVVKGENNVAYGAVKLEMK